MYVYNYVCLHVSIFILMENYVCLIFKIDVTVETTYSGITILQGDDITMSCRPSQSDIALQWSYNGSDISSSSHYHFTPPFVNHNLTITRANDTDSGNYTCAFKLGNNQQSINLTVVPSECD